MHPLLEPLEVKLLDLLLPLLLLQSVVLVDVTHQPRYYHLCPHVVAQQTTRTDLLPTGRTLLLHFTVVVLYTLTAKLVQTLPHIQRVLVHISAHWAKKGRLLYLLK